MTKTITQSQLEKLGKLGVKFNSSFCLPPFNDNHNPFFLLGDVATLDKPPQESRCLLDIGGLMVGIEAIGLLYRLHDIDGKRYLEVFRNGHYE